MPLFWVSLAFLCGILLASSASIPILGWSAAAVLSFLALMPPISRRLAKQIPPWLVLQSKNLRFASPTFYPVMILALSLGAIRYQLNRPNPNPAFITYYNDRTTKIAIEGVITEPPDVRDSYINLRVRVDRIQTADEAQPILVHGMLLARVSAGNAFNYGDRIWFQGKLETPPENEDFSYRNYLANQGIYSYLPYPSSKLIQEGQGNPIKSVLYAFRQRAVDEVYSLIPDPEASLLAGILLGIESGISPQVQEAFRQTGTSHIIVISGFNISIIAAVFTKLFRRWLGLYRGALAAAIGISFYTLLVGANPAVVRAAILGIFALGGHLIGRRQSGMNSLVFAAALMALDTPTVLWDVSFQLSFAATLGIMLYAEPMTEWFTRVASRIIPAGKAQKLAEPVGEFVLLTLAAQLTTLPVMIYYFKRLSLTALIANPLILPAQPPLMIVGGLSVLAGLIYQPFGQILAWAAWPFTAYTIKVVEWMAAFPHGSVSLGQVALPAILIFYCILFAFTFFHAQLIPRLQRMTPAIPLAVFGVVTVLVWKAALYAPDNRLHVTVLNVGTGEAVLIQSASGRNVLINGGSSTVALSDALGRRLSPFNRVIDWLVVGDIDSEDITGISGNLERFTPSNVGWSGNSTGTRAISDLQSQIISLGIPTTNIEPGQSLDLGLGAALEVLSTNPSGAVFLLEWENFRMLLPTGADFTVMDSLMQNSAMRNMTAVILPESGFAPLNPPDLISYINPQLAVLSVVAGDESGLPSPETLDALEGYHLLRTDQNGWIEITTDGEQIWVEVEKK